MVEFAVSAPEVLGKYRVIAVVGASRNGWKEANAVPLYLKRHGYTIIPVNPTATEILGERAFPSLLEIPEALARQIEVVEVFRPSGELPRIAADVAELRNRFGRPFVLWAQVGLENEEAKRVLEKVGVGYVMDACMRTVHQQYHRR